METNKDKKELGAKELAPNSLAYDLAKSKQTKNLLGGIRKETRATLRILKSWKIQDISKLQLKLEKNADKFTKLKDTLREKKKKQTPTEDRGPKDKKPEEKKPEEKKPEEKKPEEKKPRTPSEKLTSTEPSTKRPRGGFKLPELPKFKLPEVPKLNLPKIEIPKPQLPRLPNVKLNPEQLSRQTGLNKLVGKIFDIKDVFDLGTSAAKGDVAGVTSSAAGLLSNFKKFGPLAYFDAYKKASEGDVAGAAESAAITKASGSLISRLTGMLSKVKVSPNVATKGVTGIRTLGVGFLLDYISDQTLGKYLKQRQSDTIKQTIERIQGYSPEKQTEVISKIKSEIKREKDWQSGWGGGYDKIMNFLTMRESSQSETALKLREEVLKGLQTKTPPKMAEGGVVTKPTMAIIGEGGEKEYIVPQSKLQAFVASQSSGNNNEDTFRKPARLILGVVNNFISQFGTASGDITRMIGGDILRMERIFGRERFVLPIFTKGEGSFDKIVGDSIKDLVKGAKVGGTLSQDLYDSIGNLFASIDQYMADVEEVLSGVGGGGGDNLELDSENIPDVSSSSADLKLAAFLSTLESTGKQNGADVFQAILNRSAQNYGNYGPMIKQMTALAQFSPYSAVVHGNSGGDSAAQAAYARISSLLGRNPQERINKLQQIASQPDGLQQLQRLFGAGSASNAANILNDFQQGGPLSQAASSFIGGRTDFGASPGVGGAQGSTINRGPGGNYFGAVGANKPAAKISGVQTTQQPAGIGAQSNIVAQIYGTQPSQSQRPSGNAPQLQLEIHADAPGGRSGLIESLVDDTNNPLFSSLRSEYGQFPRGYRDLGGPKRGLSILELLAFNDNETRRMQNPATRSAFVDYHAKRLLNVLKRYNGPVNLWAGHADLTTGETGTSGTISRTIEGKTTEQLFNIMVAQRVAQLARASGRTNITYTPSIIANAATDPNNNWLRAQRMRGNAPSGSYSQPSSSSTQRTTQAISQSSLPPLPPTNTYPGQNYRAPRDGGRLHAGQDFDIRGNQKFYSRIGGVVVGNPFRYGDDGWAIDIYNRNLGVYERIAEAARVLVKPGDTVTPGQAVVQGESRTGVIHYEIRKKIEGGFENSTNPLEFLRNLGQGILTFGGSGEPPSGQPSYSGISSNDPRVKSLRSRRNPFQRAFQQSYQQIPQLRRNPRYRPPISALPGTSGNQSVVAVQPIVIQQQAQTQSQPAPQENIINRVYSNRLISTNWTPIVQSPST